MVSFDGALSAIAVSKLGLAFVAWTRATRWEKNGIPQVTALVPLLSRCCPAVVPTGKSFRFVRACVVARGCHVGCRPGGCLSGVVTSVVVVSSLGFAFAVVCVCPALVQLLSRCCPAGRALVPLLSCCCLALLPLCCESFCASNFSYYHSVRLRADLAHENPCS